MICSLWKIVLDPTVKAITVLDFHDMMDAEPVLDLDQGSERYGTLGGAYENGLPLGNLARKVEWTREVIYSSNAAARLAMMAHPAEAGLWAGRDFDITIRGIVGCHDNYVLRVFGFTLEAVVPRPVPYQGGGKLLWLYRGRGGKVLPVSGVPEMPGMPAEWSLTPAEDSEWIMEDGPPAVESCEF